MTTHAYTRNSTTSVDATVERVRRSGLAIVRIAAELGLHETVLRRWISRSGDAATALSPQRAGREPAVSSPADLAAENARLKRELHRIEMERDILKRPRSSSEGPPGDVRVRR
jgi:transposase